MKTKTHTSVRIECRSHADAKELALRLQADGYGAARRWKAVIARTETREDAEQLARKLEVGVVAGGSQAAGRLAILAGSGL